MLTHRCLSIAYFRVFAENRFMEIKAIPVNNMKIRVRETLNLNIIINEPTTIPAAVKSLSRPVCNASDILSRSLTVQLRTAPVFVRSKKESGSRLSFALISVLKRRLSFSAKLDIRYACSV